MKTERILCVGGPLAHQHVEAIPGTLTMLAQTKTSVAPQTKEPCQPNLDTVMYRRETLRQGTKQYEVFFISDSGEGIIKHLLQSYAEDGQPVKSV